MRSAERVRKRIADDSWLTEVDPARIRVQLESTHQEIREVEDLIAEAEQKDLDHAMQDVGKESDLDNVDPNELVLLIGDALRKDAAASSSAAWFCGAPADSSSAAPVADKDGGPPWRRSKKRRSKSQNGRECKIEKAEEHDDDPGET